MRSNTILVAFMAAAIARADPKIESEDIPQQCQDVCGPVVQLATQCWNQYDDRDNAGEEACICNSSNAGSFNSCNQCTLQYPTFLNGHTDGKGPDNDDNKVNDWSIRCRFSTSTPGMNITPMPIGDLPKPDVPGKIGILEDHDNNGRHPVVGAVPISPGPVVGVPPNSPAPAPGVTPTVPSGVPVVTVVCGRPPFDDDRDDRDDRDGDRDDRDGPDDDRNRDGTPDDFDRDDCYTTTLYGTPAAGATPGPVTNINGAPIPTADVYCDNDGDGDRDRCTSYPAGFGPTGTRPGTTFTRIAGATPTPGGSSPVAFPGAAGAVSASVFYVGAGLVAGVMAVL